MNNHRQNDVSYLYLKGSDLLEREKEVLKDASQKTGFKAEKITKRSGWWGSKEIGAFFCKGIYQDKPAILKIQGVKPLTSEIYMIESFKKANQSNLIRPPHLYTYLPWSDEERYEALVLEEVKIKNRILNLPTNEAELDKFFNAYLEYKKNCLNAPWLDKPNITISEKIADNFSKWKDASFKLYPAHPLRDKEDQTLIDKAVEILINKYRGVEFEFQHGHFSEVDLREKDGQVILLSNLYWGWKPPLYDAIFGYHWFIYHLGNIKDISPGEIERQRDLWIKKIENLPNVKQDDKHYKLALLERATAGLNLDVLTIDPTKQIARYLVEATRKQIVDLLSYFPC